MTDAPEEDAPPPVLGRWRNLYLVVVGNLALTVALLWAFCRAWQ